MNVEHRRSNIQHRMKDQNQQFVSFIGGVVEKLRFSIQRSMFNVHFLWRSACLDAASPASPASCLLHLGILYPESCILFLASCILHPVSCILQ